MAYTVESLILEFDSNFEKYNRNVDAAVRKASQDAQKLERAFARSFDLKVNVDDRRLFDLNKHIDLKLSHLDRAQRQMDRAPLTVKTDNRQIDKSIKKVQDFKKEVESLQFLQPVKLPVSIHAEQSAVNVTVQHVVKAQGSSEFQSAVTELKQSARQIGRDISGEVSKSRIKTEQKSGGVLGAIASPFKAIGQGILSGSGMAFGMRLGDGVSKSFEKRINQSLESMGARLEQHYGDLAERVSDKFFKKIGFERGLQDIKSEVSDTATFIENAFEDSFEHVGEIVFNTLTGQFDKIADEAKGLAADIGGAGLRVAYTPVRVRNQAMASVGAQQAQQLSQNIQVPKNIQANSITLYAGGLTGQKGGIENAMFGMPFAKPLLKDTHMEAVSNSFLNDFSGATHDALMDVYNVLKSLGVDFPKEILDGFNAAGEPDVSQIVGRIAKMFDLAIAKGIDPDAVGIAARAAAYRREYPDKPINIMAHSGGGWNVANAIDYTNRMGLENVHGVGAMTPFTGLSRPLPRNFTPIMGSDDQFYQAFFKSAPGLFRTAQGAETVPNANYGHSLATFFPDQRIQEQLFKAFNMQRPDLSEITFQENKQGAIGFGRYAAVRGGDDKNVYGSISKMFGKDAPFSYFVNEQNPLPVLDAITSIQKQIEKAIKSLKNSPEMKAEAERYLDMLNTLGEEITNFHATGGEMLPVESLKKASEFFEGLKELQSSIDVDAISQRNQEIKQTPEYQSQLNQFKFAGQFAKDKGNLTRTIQQMHGQSVNGYSFADAPDSLKGLKEWFTKLAEPLDEFNQQQAHELIGFLDELESAIREFQSTGKVPEGLTEKAQKHLGVDQQTLMHGSTKDAPLYTPPDYEQVFYQSKSIEDFLAHGQGLDPYAARQGEQGYEQISHASPLTFRADLSGIEGQLSLQLNNALEKATQDVAPTAEQQLKQAVETLIAQAIKVQDIIVSGNIITRGSVDPAYKQPRQLELRFPQQSQVSDSWETATQQQSNTMQKAADTLKAAAQGTATAVQRVGEGLEFVRDKGEEARPVLDALGQIVGGVADAVKELASNAIADRANEIRGPSQMALPPSGTIVPSGHQQSGITAQDIGAIARQDTQKVIEVTQKGIQNVKKLADTTVNAGKQVKSFVDGWRGAGKQIDDVGNAVYETTAEIVTDFEELGGAGDHLKLLAAHIYRLEGALQDLEETGTSTKMLLPAEQISEADKKAAQLIQTANELSRVLQHITSGPGLKLSGLQGGIGNTQDLHEALDLIKQVETALAKARYVQGHTYDQGFNDLIAQTRDVQKPLGVTKSGAYRGILANLEQTKEAAKAGDNTAQGFINSLIAAIPEINGVANKTGKEFISQIKSVLGIASPSKVMLLIGKQVVEGFEIGLEDLPNLEQILGEKLANIDSPNLRPIQEYVSEISDYLQMGLEQIDVQLPDLRYFQSNQSNQSKPSQDFSSTIKNAEETAGKATAEVANVAASAAFSAWETLKSLLDTVAPGVSGFIEGFSTQLDELGQKHPALEKITSGFKEISVAVLASAAAFLFILAPLSQFYVESIKAANEFQNLTYLIQGSGQNTRSLVEIETYANKIGTSFRAAADSYAQFAGSLIGTPLQDDALDLEKKMIGVTKALNLSQERSNQFAVAVQQMAAKGVISMEELRGQAAEAVPQSTIAAAAALNTEVSQLTNTISQGTTSSYNFLPKFLDSLSRMTSGTLDATSQNLDSQMARIENAFFKLQRTVGAGPLDVVTKGAGLAAAALGFLADNAQLVNLALTVGMIAAASSIANTVIKVLKLAQVWTLLETLGARGLFAKGVSGLASGIGSLVASINPVTVAVIGLTAAWAIFSAYSSRGTASVIAITDQLTKSLEENNKALKGRPDASSNTQKPQATSGGGQLLDAIGNFTIYPLLKSGFLLDIPIEPVTQGMVEADKAAKAVESTLSQMDEQISKINQTGLNPESIEKYATKAKDIQGQIESINSQLALSGSGVKPISGAEKNQLIGQRKSLQTELDQLNSQTFQGFGSVSGVQLQIDKLKQLKSEIESTGVSSQNPELLDSIDNRINALQKLYDNFNRVMAVNKPLFDLAAAQGRLDQGNINATISDAGQRSQLAQLQSQFAIAPGQAAIKDAQIERSVLQQRLTQLQQFADERNKILETLPAGIKTGLEGLLGGPITSATQEQIVKAQQQVESNPTYFQALKPYVEKLGDLNQAKQDIAQLNQSIAESNNRVSQSVKDFGDQYADLMYQIEQQTRQMSRTVEDARNQARDAINDSRLEIKRLMQQIKSTRSTNAIRATVKGFANDTSTQVVESVASYLEAVFDTLSGELDRMGNNQKLQQSIRDLMIGRSDLFNSLSDQQRQMAIQMAQFQGQPTAGISGSMQAIAPARVNVGSWQDASGEPGSDFTIHDKSDKVLGVPVGFPVESQVLKVRNEPNGYGNAVELRFKYLGKEVDVLIAHFQKLSEGIKEGAILPAGAILGNQGRTGHTSAGINGSGNPGGDLGTHVSADFYQPGTNTGLANELRLKFLKEVWFPFIEKGFNGVNLAQNNIVPFSLPTGGTSLNAGNAGGESDLRMTSTGKRDGRGLEIFKLDLLKGGKVVDSMLVSSGKPGNQTMLTGAASTAGNKAPIPEGVYSLGKKEWAGKPGDFDARFNTKNSEALGSFWLPLNNLTENNRGAFGIHLDNDAAIKPGSDGCIVLGSKAQIAKFQQWIDQSDPSKLTVDYGFGTVAKPKVSSGAIATQQPISIPKFDNAFIQKIAMDALKVQAQTKIPASIMIAQAALETGYGKYAPGNNFFGIKGTGSAGSQSLTTTEVYNGVTQTVRDSFRKYNTPAESFADWTKLILKDPYYQKVAGKSGVESAKILQQSGYATDPAYASKLTSIIKQYGLDQLDAMGSQLSQADGTIPMPNIVGQLGTIPYGDQIGALQQQNALANQLSQVQDATKKIQTEQQFKNIINQLRDIQRQNSFDVQDLSNKINQTIDSFDPQTTVGSISDSVIQQEQSRVDQIRQFRSDIASLQRNADTYKGLIDALQKQISVVPEANRGQIKTTIAQLGQTLTSDQAKLTQYKEALNQLESSAGKSARTLEYQLTEALKTVTEEQRQFRKELQTLGRMDGPLTPLINDIETVGEQFKTTRLKAEAELQKLYQEMATANRKGAQAMARGDKKGAANYANYADTIGAQITLLTRQTEIKLSPEAEKKLVEKVRAEFNLNRFMEKLAYSNQIRTANLDALAQGEKNPVKAGKLQYESRKIQIDQQFFEQMNELDRKVQEYQRDIATIANEKLVSPNQVESIARLTNGLGLGSNQLKQLVDLAANIKVNPDALDQFNQLATSLGIGEQDQSFLKGLADSGVGGSQIEEIGNLARNLGLSADEAARLRETLLQTREISLKNLADETNYLQQQIESGLNSAFGDLFMNIGDVILGTKDALTTLQEFGAKVLQMLAQIFADIAAKQLASMAGKFLGSLFGGIPGFSGGGAINNYYGGGMVRNYASGGTPEGDMGAWALGMGMMEAMDREGVGAVPIVANNREYVLNEHDTKLWQWMGRKGLTSDLRRAKANNYATGGVPGQDPDVMVVGSASTGRGVGRSQTIVINQNTTVNTPDANSFRATKAQMDRDRAASAQRAAQRLGKD